MLVTLKELDLGSDKHQEHRVWYYERGDAPPTSKDGLYYDFKVSHTSTFSIQQLLEYISSPNRLTSYTEKDSAIQALNVAMSRRPASAPDVAVLPGGNKFFRKDAQICDLGGGLLALRGYYTSVRTATLRLLLNVNSITSAFYKPGNLLSLMQEFRKSYEENRKVLPPLLLNNFLKGIQVEVSYLKTSKGSCKTKVVFGIARKPELMASAQKIRFKWDETNSTLSVEEYFKRSKIQVFITYAAVADRTQNTI